jgi:hypothetical protein
MSAQPELKMFVAEPDDKNVRWLENLLKGAQCWMTAKDIMLTVNGKLIDRDLRSLASASANIISGQKGYKHIKHATAEEISHAANWLESQAKKMSDRAGAIRRNAHRIFG